MFPSQFDLTLSWNPGMAGSKKLILNNDKNAKNTNYVEGHIMIDQKTNRMRMDTSYSTLSLLP